MNEQKLPAWQDVLGDAEQLVRQKPPWSKFIKGTPLENDVPVWIADFALRLLQRDRAAHGVVPVDPDAALHACTLLEIYLRDQRNPYPVGAVKLIRDYIGRTCGVVLPDSVPVPPSPAPVVQVAERLTQAAHVLAEFAKTAPGRLPQTVQDAIAVALAAAPQEPRE